MKKEFYGYIYLIKNTVNGKLYFGQTIQGFKKRYVGNLEKYTENEHLRNSIKKYGIENFEIREEFDKAYSKDELDRLEDMYICLYNTINDNYGYNKRRGGSRGRLSMSSREKISQSKMGENNPMYGKTLSESHKNAISLSQKGSKNYNARQVICVETQEIFPTVVEASKWAGLSTYNSISKCCKGITTCAGRHPITKERLRWRYYDEVKDTGLIPLREFSKPPKKEDVKNNGAVICINTSEIFTTIEEAKNWSKVHSIKLIHNVCVGLISTAGKHPITGERLRWKYVEDISPSDQMKRKRHGKVKKVVCVNTGEVFNSTIEASIKYNICSSSITSCCKGKRKTCGVHKESGERLMWKYYTE